MIVAMPDPNEIYPPGVRSIPHDRLTRMANDIGHGMKDHPLYQDGDRVIVLVDDSTHGGIGIMDYEDPRDAIADMVGHLKALCKPYGIHLDMILLP